MNREQRRMMEKVAKSGKGPSQPKSFASFVGAKQAGQLRGLKLATAIFLRVMKDKEGATSEDVNRIWKEIEDMSDSIAKGYVKLEDIQQSLLEEDGINLTR